MANNLGNVVEKFTTRLDQVLAVATKTADLNMNQDLLGEYRGNGKIEIASIAMDGLGDYDRAKGFPVGDVDLTWEPYQMKYDRGREFSIDSMDDEERETLVSANLMGLFAREKVVPEVDAIRFARIATAAGKTVEMQEVTPDAARDAIMEAEAVLEDSGLAIGEFILYATSAFINALRKAEPYHIGQGEAPNTRFVTYDDMKIVTVPQNRFYTAIETNDGTTGGQEDGGYKKGGDAKDLRFIIMHPSAVAALQRHEKLRYFAPDTNQEKDAHKWQYRLYHDLLVYKNQKQLIYACTGSEGV